MLGENVVDPVELIVIVGRSVNVSLPHTAATVAKQRH
jgi:hypothetical protein